MRKLLIVDDDNATRILITEILAGANVVIIECGCGKDAVSLFKSNCNEIVLVLLDIKLPDCKGWDLCKQFRLFNERIPIIAISAILPAELKQYYKAAGFTSYVSKPFDMNEFAELIKSYL